MQLKLIYFLFIVLIFGLFAGFNLHNTTEISLIFTTLKDIPIYISNLFSFLIGVVIMLPFLSKRSKRQKDKDNAKKAEQEANGVKTINLKKKKRFWQKKAKKEDASTIMNTTKKKSASNTSESNEDSK